LCGARNVADSAADRYCAACDTALPRLPPRHCRVCAIALESGDTCGACLDRPPRYDSASAAYGYAFPIDALIRAYKYGGHLTLAPVLGAALADAAVGDVDAIVPMPLSDARLRERGFNQAHELARHAGRRLALPVLPHACRRVVDTAPQASLPWAERSRNVRGVFVCDADLAGKQVAIVDDVMTTGATLNELARTLKRAGAACVSAWVVARTQRDELPGFRIQ
jgi:ComF family protein